MAGQDLKNYTRIWNPILEALAKSKLSPNQYKICLALFQNTYTWHRTEARLGYRDIERDTGIKAKKLSQPFRQLVDEYNVIIEVQSPSFNAPGLYKFNKDIRKWSQKVLDITQISETNFLIVVEECDGGIPIKGTPPHEGDCPREGGEGTPQNGGEGPPHDGDTEQPSNPWDTTDAGDLKKDLKKVKDISTTTPTAPDGESIFKKFEQEFGRPLSPIEAERIMAMEKEHPPDLITEALKKAVINGKLNIRYIETILVDWKKNKIKTLLEVKRQDEEFEKRKRQRDGPAKTAKPKGDGKYAKLGNARPEDFL